jgi:hypothetical protein
VIDAGTFRLAQCLNHYATPGPKYEDGEWKSRKNRELEELNNGENIVKWIKDKLAGSPGENGGE